MTQKKRVYDLAKEYGMSGQDLAKKLRDLGFSHVRGHMTALDDFEVLQIQGVLEAHGLIQESGRATVDAGGGLVLRKKKKKLTAAGEEHEEPVETSVAPAAPVAPEASTADVEAPLVDHRPEVDEEPVRKAGAETRAHAATIDTDLDLEVQPAPATTRREPPISTHVPPAPAPTITPARPAAAVPPPRVEPLPAEAPPAERVRAAEAPATPAKPAPVDERVIDAPAAEVALEPEVDDVKVVPAVPARRLGKVVGFVDLSKIKSQPAKKTESRRLRSKDDVAPNVQPTLGHDKKRALVRGDRGARDQLTPGQLRERESARFLRRRGPTTGTTAGGPGTARPATRGPRRDEASGSPYSGTRVKIEAPVNVKKLAETLSVKPGELFRVAFDKGKLGLPFGSIQINSLLDNDTATLIAHEFGVEIDIVQAVEAEETLISDLKKKRTDVDDLSLVVRPPTVAFLGHVDHGKTTLIDAIRNSRVAEGEAGGITQHIGAYEVRTKLGHQLTIIDTPGHAAFTAMRARGAHAVDIVVLVVAADDGPMPHTEEALNHARAAKTPVVVALTKIDKAEANPKRAMEALARLGLVPEAWGGETAMLEVSAVKNIGVDELLERVFLESEVLELKCHPKGPASGVVLEAEIQQGKGIVAHLLVQDGTLNRGDIILAGEGYGKVRSMHDDRGQVVDSAPPAMPVEVSGLSALPGVGESFYVVEELAKAKEVAEERERKNRAMSLTERRTVSAESLMRVVADESRHTINLVVRADVQGSVEVLRASLGELKHEEVEVRVLNAGVGAVTESDVLLASTSNAIIIAFHVGVNDKARLAAERAGIEIRYYEVIYQLLDDMHALMEGTLSPEISEEITGRVEVRTLFKSSKVGTIAGCHVIEGSIFRDSRVRVLRDSQVIHSGALASLRREKDDAKEVREGFDCGIVVRDYPDVREGDIIEAYKMVKTRRTLGDRTKV